MRVQQQQFIAFSEKKLEAVVAMASQIQKNKEDIQYLLGQGGEGDENIADLLHEMQEQIKALTDDVSDNAQGVKDLENNKLDNTTDEFVGTLSISGGQLDMTGNSIVRVPDPVDERDAANKRYVDALDVSDQPENYVKKDGDVTIGDYDFTAASDGVSMKMRVQGDIIVKAKGESITAGNLFSAMRESERVQYYGKFDDDTCVETVGHVQDNYLSSKGGTGDGDYDFQNCLMRVKGDLFVKDKDQSINGSNVFEIRRQTNRFCTLALRRTSRANTLPRPNGLQIS